MVQQTEPRGVLFDVDGTLVDTNYLHALCWAEALRQHGHVVPMSKAHHAIGMASNELLDHLIGPVPEQHRNELDAAHLTLYQQFWGRIVPLAGAADLLRRCATAGSSVLLASSASQHELTMLRTVIDAEDAIDGATGADDADTGKPAPDILQAALDKGGLRADQAVLVGDSEWDGRAAQRAGLRFVALTCGGTDESCLREAGAVEVWTDPSELVRNFDSSVLGRR